MKYLYILALICSITGAVVSGLDANWSAMVWAICAGLSMANAWLKEIEISRFDPH